MRPHTPSPPRFPREAQQVSFHHPELPGRRARLLLYCGPDIAPAVTGYLRRLADGSGMPALLLSCDEARGRIRSSVKLALRHLDAEPHILINAHGALDGRHEVRAGGLTGEPREERVSTADLLAWMALRLGRRGAGIPVFHVFSCSAGHLSGDIVPGSDRWRSAYVIIYSGKQSVGLGQVNCALVTAMRYLRLCEQHGRPGDPLRLFLLAGLRRGECMTLLGGELQAPLRWHGPKSNRDLTDKHRQAALMDGHPADLERLARAAGAVRPEETALLPNLEEAEIDIFRARLLREDVAGMQAMLEQRPALANAADCAGRQPLICAIDYGSTAAVGLLLAHGASLDARDIEGNTPLTHLSKSATDIEPSRALCIANRLLGSGADPNQRDGDDNPALVCAIDAGSSDLVQLLLAHGADPTQGSGDETPLALARRLGHEEMAEMLLTVGATE